MLRRSTLIVPLSLCSLAALLSVSSLPTLAVSVAGEAKVSCVCACKTSDPRIPHSIKRWTWSGTREACQNYSGASVAKLDSSGCSKIVIPKSKRRSRHP
jgi:hypothetical protein